MPVVIHGGGTIEGIATGGLPDGCVDADMLASNAVTSVKIIDDAITGAKIAGSAVTAGKISGFKEGISGYDTFTLTADKNWSGTNTFDGDFSRNTNFPSIGSAWSHSSGAFTAPTTGLWEIYFQVQLFDGTTNAYCNLQIGKSTDSGGSYTHIASSADSIHDDDQNVYSNPSVLTIVDVTNTSTLRLKFTISNEQGAQLDGHSTEFRTGVIFKRIGDT